MSRNIYTNLKACKQELKTGTFESWVKWEEINKPAVGLDI